MKPHVALLRGINLGRRKVPMAALREVLSGLGHQEIRTLLNSGNAVFTPGSRSSPARLAATLERALGDRFGFEVPTIVLNAAQFERVIDENPLKAEAHTHPSQFLVAFVQEPDSLLPAQRLAGRHARDEQVAFGPSAAYLSLPGGIHDSKTAATLLRLTGPAATTRNWSTVLSLAQAASGTP